MALRWFKADTVTGKIPDVIVNYIRETIGSFEGIQGEKGDKGDKGDQGIRGGKWFFSESANPDYSDVLNPLEGDIFLYPSSRDFFQYRNGAWVYAGNISVGSTQPDPDPDPEPDPDPDPEPEPEPNPQPTARVFGAEGNYWPSKTPKFTDTFEHTIEIDPTWAAMTTAINTINSETAKTAKTQILVRDGILPVGFGSGSTSNGVLQNIGAVDRDWNILIRPKNGLGKVSVAKGNDVAFVNVGGFSIVGIDFDGISILQRNTVRFHISHTFAINGNMTSNGGQAGQRDSEYVECVFGPEDMVTEGTDRCAIRTNNGFAAVNNGYIGVYFATVQRRDGATGHCDTLQFSSQNNTENIGTRIIGSVLWPSANQAWIASETPHAKDVYVENSLFIGGPPAFASRYPQTPRNVNGTTVNLYQTTGANTFVGGATNITMKDSVVIGTISDNHTWKEVSNVLVSEAQANPQNTGTFTLDQSLNNWTDSDFNKYSPFPSKERQYAKWAAQFLL